MKTKVLSGFIGRVVLLSLVIALLTSCGGGPQPAGQTGAPTAAGEVIKWRYQSMGTPGMKQYWVYEELIKRITAATNGRLQIELLPVGAVVGTMESFDAVGKGVVEVGSS